MTARWKSVSLGELCQIARGGSPRPIDKFLTNSEDGINWVKIGDATAGDGKYISSTKEKIRPEGQKMSRLVRPGDFLLTNSMSFGRPYIMQTEGCIHDGWLVLRDQSGQLDPDFLYHFLGSDAAYKQFDALAAGSTVRNLNTELVKRVSVVVPPMAEQKRIVAILDDVVAGIAQATANNELNAHKSLGLFSSQLRHLFGVEGSDWPRKAIGDVADARLGKMLDKLKNRGVLKPYLRNLNVRWFDFDLSDVRQMPFEDDEFEKYSAKRGDLLIVEGGYPGRAAVWENDEPIYLQKAVHRVRFEDPRLSKILMYMLFAWNNDGSLQQHFSGTGIQHLTGQALAGISMPIPPAGKRDEIIERIEAMLAVSVDLQRLYRTKCEVLANLKQSLLVRAFSGELTREPLAA